MAFCHTRGVPKLWSETIEEHRSAVREATLDATAELVAEHGLTAVTMSQIAQRTGIGRATLYKYFPDVETILLAWHERQVETHLASLTAIEERTPGSPVARLEAVLLAFAAHARHGHDDRIAAMLHRGEHLATAERRLHDFVARLIHEAVAAGELRDDVPAGELASYSLHALTASGTIRTRPGRDRLVGLIVDGMRGG